MIRVHEPFRRKGRPYYFLRYIDPTNQKPVEKSSGKRRKREANEVARRWERELNSDEPEGVYWDDFCEQYENDKLSHRSAKGLESWKTTVNHFNRLKSRPVFVNGINAKVLQRFAAMLRREKKSEASIHTYLARLRAALNWGDKMGFTAPAPRFDMPSLGKVLARSRAISLEEFERLLTCVPLVRKRDPERWTRLLWGLWESGFRISELLKVSWSPTAEWSIQSGSIPLIRIDEQKNGNEQLQPITPEFWQLLKEGPRTGHAFVLPGRREQQMTAKAAIRVVSDIGEESKIITDHKKKKMVTSHDLRRSFAVRMGSKLSLLELSQWMRHSSPDTTKKYYHVQPAESLANKVW